MKAGVSDPIEVLRGAWQSLYADPVSTADVIEIQGNIVGFFGLLHLMELRRKALRSA